MSLRDQLRLATFVVVATLVLVGGYVYLYRLQEVDAGVTMRALVSLAAVKYLVTWKE